jgi:hypothetical protein
MFLNLWQNHVWQNSLFFLNRNIGFICKRLSCNKKPRARSLSILVIGNIYVYVYNNDTVYDVILYIVGYNIVTDFIN